MSSLLAFLFKMSGYFFAGLIAAKGFFAHEIPRGFVCPRSTPAANPLILTDSTLAL
jgi:hypothetical protein